MNAVPSTIMAGATTIVGGRRTIDGLVRDDATTLRYLAAPRANAAAKSSLNAVTRAGTCAADG